MEIAGDGGEVETTGLGFEVSTPDVTGFSSCCFSSTTLDEDVSTA